jgi:Gram-negative bacterial TonB protein C-terminal
MNEDPVMRKPIEIAIWSAVVVGSLGLHAAAFGGLGSSRADGFGKKKPRPPTLIEMTVASLSPPPAPPDVPRPAAAQRAPRLALGRPAHMKAARSPGAPPPPSAAPPPADETPADFTGVTMTNDAPGVGWNSATGNGASMQGPLGRPGARVTHRNVDGDGAATARRAGPPIVAAVDLSSAPRAPELGDRLARAYPADARAKGVEGKAVMRARVMPDGQLRELALLSESARGFGSACRETLRGSQWSPPVDRAGHAVSTFINYTCRFDVQ